MKRILIVEDDRALGDGLCLALKGPEAEAVLCRTLSAARSALGAGDFDLVVLDVNLPDGNGLDFLRELRGGANRTPAEPLPLAVLRARVNAQLRRDRGAVQSGPLVLDGFSFDFERMEFRRDGRLIDLSKTEQKLLRILVENRGRTLPRELLVDRVWTDGAEYVDENALSVTVKRLRGKLEDTPSKPRYLKTVYGIGYVWSAGEREAP